MKKTWSAISALFFAMLLLCAPLSAFADTSQTNELDSLTAVIEHHRDLRITIPADMMYDRYEGAWSTLEIYMDPQATSGFLDIAARQMHTQDPPILLDEQDLPILNTDAVRELLNGTQSHSVSVLDSGETRLAGNPASYIEVLFYGDTERESPDWKAKVIRTVYEGFAYDLMYAAPAEEYEAYLPNAASIIESVQIDTRENETETVTLGDITLAHPIRNVNVSSTDTSFQISVRITGIVSQFRAELDNSRIYEEGFLDNIHWLNLHLLSLTERKVSPTINASEPTELSREEILLSGKRALRVVYHIYDSVLYKNYYAEAIVFTYNGGLYSLFSKDHEGEDARLHEFAQPMIDSVRFNENALPPTFAPTTDTVRWINYSNAILTLANGGDVELYGGMKATSETQFMARNSLQQFWGITSKDSLDAALIRLRESGHRATFSGIIAGFPQLFGLNDEDFALAIQNETETLRELKENLEERIRFLTQLSKLSEHELASSVINRSVLNKLMEEEIAELAELEKTLDMMDSAAVKQYLEHINRIYRESGENALLAWDYVRAINLIGEGYLIGFYSFEEALDISLEFAVDLQNAFSSWDALYGDYLAGYAFWNHGDENDPTTENYRRAELIKGLMLLSRGPSTFPYDTPLTADWPEPPETIEIKFASVIGDITAPLDTHGRPDKAPFNTGDTLEFLLTADMFDWTNMDPLIVNTAMLYGWDTITNYENSPVHPSVLINAGVAVGFESATPQIIRLVDITETAYPHPDFPDLRTACVKIVFANNFADLHNKEFESTLYLTLGGERVPQTEITLSGMLFDYEAEQFLIEQERALAEQKLKKSVMVFFLLFFVAVIALIVLFVYRRKKRLAHRQAMWEKSAISEGRDEDNNSRVNEKDTRD